MMACRPRIPLCGGLRIGVDSSEPKVPPLVIVAPMLASGKPNWAPFAAKSTFFGEILGTETLSAFMLEAGFLGIMILGWNRVPPKLHFFATCMVVVGLSLSVFWIMVANSWMQTPAGVVMQDGRLILTSYREAIFNPDMVFGVTHMYVACLETSLFVIGGISAWYVLRRRHVEFFARSFKVALIAAVAIAIVVAGYVYLRRLEAKKEPTSSAP